MAICSWFTYQKWGLSSSLRKHSPEGRPLHLLTTLDAHSPQVDAVWPGWGHASENPKLPATLKENGIIFIGPPSGAGAGPKLSRSGPDRVPSSGSPVQFDHLGSCWVTISRFKQLFYWSLACHLKGQTWKAGPNLDHFNVTFFFVYPLVI